MPYAMPQLAAAEHNDCLYQHHHVQVLPELKIRSTECTMQTAQTLCKTVPCIGVAMQSHISEAVATFSHRNSKVWHREAKADKHKSRASPSELLQKP